MSDPVKQYVDAQVAATALGVDLKTVYRIAHSEKWQHTDTKPRGYLLADVRRTARRRKKRDPAAAEAQAARRRLERERRAETMLRDYFDR
jgi:hypothetical protein